MLRTISILLSVLLIGCGSPAATNLLPESAPLPEESVTRQLVCPISSELLFQGIIDKVSGDYFCPAWAPWDGTAAYQFDGASYEMTFRPATNSESASIALLEPGKDPVAYDLENGDVLTVVIWSKDFSIAKGPVNFLYLDGEMYIDETLIDVIRNYQKPSGQMG